MSADTKVLPVKEKLLLENGVPYDDSMEELVLYHWDDNSRTKWTGMLFIGSVLVYSSRSSMSVTVTSIGKELGWNKQVSGLILSSFFAGYITTNVLGGRLADKFGGEKIMVYCGLLWSTMTLLIPFAVRYPFYVFLSNTFAVVGARFLTGVGQGMHFPSVSSVISKRNSINNRIFPFSISMSGASIGTILSGFVGSLLIENLGWSTYFYLVGLLSAFWILLLWKLASIRSNKDSKITSSQDNNNGRLPSKNEPLPWRVLVTKFEVWALIITNFCSSLCFFNLFSWLPVYFHDKYPQSKGWVFNVVPWIFSFVFSNISGYLSTVLLRKGFTVTFVRKLCTSVSLGGPAVLLLLLNVAETFHQTLFLLSVSMAMLSFGNAGPLQNPQDLAPKHAGALFGVVNTINALSGIIGVYLTGYILETVGDWSGVFQLTSAVCIVGFLTFELFGSAERIV